MSKLLIQKQQSEYILMTKDRKKVLVGSPNNLRLVEVDKLDKRTKILTRSSKKLMENILYHWYNARLFIPDIIKAIKDERENINKQLEDGTLEIPYGTNPTVGYWVIDHRPGYGTDYLSEETHKLIKSELDSRYEIVEVKLGYMEV